MQMSASEKRMHARHQCETCGANNIAVARFCGNCGAALAAKNLRSGKRSRRKIFFKGILTLALFILVASVVMSYQLFNSTDSIKVSLLPFADVPSDHPVYSLCPNLIRIQAIGYRKILELAPYEPISAAEWNHALSAVASNLGRNIPGSAFFQEGSKVSSRSIREKIAAVAGKTENVGDNSRIKSFYLLERALFNRRPVL